MKIELEYPYKDLYKYAESLQVTRDIDRDLVNYLSILEKNMSSLELLVTDKQNVKRELNTFIKHYKLRYNEKSAWLGKFSEMAVRSWPLGIRSRK